METLTGIYKNMVLGVVALVFRCRATGGELTRNDEVTEFRWVPDAELDDAMTPAFVSRARDALRYNGVPAVRSHDGNAVLD